MKWWSNYDQYEFTNSPLRAPKEVHEDSITEPYCESRVNVCSCKEELIDQAKMKLIDAEEDKINASIKYHLEQIEHWKNRMKNLCKIKEELRKDLRLF